MAFQVQIKMNEKLFLRDPEQSDLGRKMISHSVTLINQIGFEAFTFKKLAAETGTTEASIYRYFENKHRLLVYLTTWYWSWQEFRVSFQNNNINDPLTKLKKVVHLLVVMSDNEFESDYLNIITLHQIVITEGTKTYLTKHVTEDNKDQLFKPYKDLCKIISDIILENNPKYRYPRSLASTMIEIAHFQDFFMRNLPSLTDFPKSTDTKQIIAFLEDLVFGAIRKK